ncbi:MAG TPA: PH domain-containing protein [Gammaproteobacteria bacterium]|jgi:hypothetical protein
MSKSFPLAPMSSPILVLTVLLLALPFALLAGALYWTPFLAVPALLMIASYAWVWLRFRPSQFTVDNSGLLITWPLKRRRIRREEISGVRVLNGPELKREIGWGLRVGAGGLWGGFGWLWTKRRGIVQMYVSRTDRFVWIERVGRRPWLITPEQPESFARSLSSR